MSECHAQEISEFDSSIHGTAAKNGDPDAPNCLLATVQSMRSRPPPSQTRLLPEKKLADTCAKCHSDAGFLSRHKIPVAHPVESYKLSVHGRAIAAGSDKAANCNSCHGNHYIYPATGCAFPGNRWKIADTCGYCHKESPRCTTKASTVMQSNPE